MQITEESYYTLKLLIRNVSGLVKMNFRLVHASYSLPEWQALNGLSLHPVLPTNIKKVLKIHEINYSGALAREARAAEQHG